MAPIVRVEGLRKTFRVSRRTRAGLRSAVRGLVRREHVEVDAVDGLDLTVDAGEIRALLGPNGAGKSTTVKVLCGILHPTAGHVRCLGMTPWRDRMAYVRRIGAVFGQKSQLQWDLPPVDSFELNRRLYRIPKAMYRSNLAYFVESFRLAGVLGKPVRSLSLGERMRCELTATLLHDPPLVFLDEPTVGLDLLAKDAVRRFVRDVNRERGVTFLLTTHDLDDVEDLCHTVTVINNGTVVFDRPIQELRRGYGDRKTVRLTFSRPVSRAELAGWAIEAHDGAEATVLLDCATDEFVRRIGAVLATLPVQDIEIQSPDIDSIIRDIYSRSPGRPTDRASSTDRHANREAVHDRAGQR